MEGDDITNEIIVLKLYQLDKGTTKITLTLAPMTLASIRRPLTYHVTLGSGLPQTLHLKSTGA